MSTGVHRLVALALVAAALVAPAGGRSATHATRLVFAATVARGQSQIFSIAPSGRAPAQLTFGTAPASSPLPSPDGKHVLFARGDATWTMRPNGQSQRLLVAHGIEPAWAPDSRRLAYVSVTAQNDRLGIRVVGVDGKNNRLLAKGADVSAPAWSRDGRLAFARAGSLVVMRGHVTRTIVKGLGTDIERISWSADGRWLAVDYADPSRGFGFEVVRSSGRSRRDLQGVRYGSAAWAPTRAELAYVESGTSPGSGRFTLLSPETGRVRQLAPAPSYVNALAWSPDGGALAFSSGTYLSEDLTATSALGVVTVKGRVHALDPAMSYPLPESVAWTTSSAGTHYRRPVPVGPLVSTNELRLREPVDEVTADGGRVAYRSCGTIAVWRPGEHKVVTLQADRPLCGETNIGFYSLALAGDRVAWGSLQGGNFQTNGLTIETVGEAAPPIRVVLGSHITGDPRGSERAGDLRGTGSLLAFSTWRYCDDVADSPCPGVHFGEGKILSQTLWRLREPSWPGECPNSRPGSAPCEQLRVEPGPLRLLDVAAGRIVVSGDNATLVLDADADQLLTLPVSTTAAQLAGSDLVVVVPGALRDYDATTGALLHSWPLPDVSFAGSCGVPSWVCPSARLRLEGEARGVVAYVLDGTLHLLRLDTGADAVVADATAAALDDGGLVYAFRASGTWPGRVRFVPFDRLLLR
jgi:hypothetical protein